MVSRERTDKDIQIGPTVEFAYPPSLYAAIQDDQSLSRLLPFLALPDGAHLVSPLGFDQPPSLKYGFHGLTISVRARRITRTL